MGASINMTPAMTNALERGTVIAIHRTRGTLSQIKPMVARYDTTANANRARKRLCLTKLLMPFRMGDICHTARWSWQSIYLGLLGGVNGSPLVASPR